MHTRIKLTLPTNVDPSADMDLDLNVTSVSKKVSTSVLSFVPVLSPVNEVSA
jgi:hypothetical protein